MRVLLFILFFVSFSSKSFSSCDIFIPVKDFWLAGQVITFDFEHFLIEKKLIETNNQIDAEFVLMIEGKEIREQFFRHALGKISVFSKLGEPEIYEYRTRCLTQLCGVSDFMKSFNRAFRKLRKSHTVCRE